MSNFPKHWKTVDLEECVDILDNMRVPVNANERAERQGDVPYYGATGQAGWIDDFIFNEELVLLGEDGAPFYEKEKNVAFLVTGKSWVNNHAHVLKARDRITLNRFVLYYLNYFDYTGYVGGTTRLKLTQRSLRKIPFPLPPLPEQKRIVAKLNTLFTHLDQLRARLDKIPVLLKQFRQAVLTQAVTGKLTEEWRRGKSLKEVEITKTRTKDKTFLTDRVNEYNLYDLPKLWNWRIVADVADVKGGKRLPKGESLVARNTGFPYIKAGDLKNGTVLTGHLEFLLPSTREKIKRYTVNKGDVYLTNVGACIGDAGVIPAEMDNANLTENALKICNHEGVYNYYLSFWLQSPIAQAFIQKTILSGAQGKLALGRVQSFPVPLPPFAEQKEIVRRIEAFFVLAESIDAKFQSLKRNCDHLPQEILSKAFRGELVKDHIGKKLKGYSQEAEDLLMAAEPMYAKKFVEKIE